MSLLDLSKWDFTCAGCGQRIDIGSWRLDHTREVLVSMRVHDQRWDWKIDDTALGSAAYQFDESRGYRTYDMAVNDYLEMILHDGWRQLSMACPRRTPIPLGQVVNGDGMTIEPTHQAIKRPKRGKPVITVKPLVQPVFGKPIARKIIK